MVEQYQKHASQFQLCEMCMYNLQLLGQTDWQGLNLFNPKAFLLVADWQIGANFEPYLDLTLTYKILSWHILSTIRIWIAATDTALKVSKSVYCFTTSISHGVENNFPGCGVRASLMPFLTQVSIRSAHFC